MKVYIGPHVEWIGPYQVADWLQKVGVSEERCHEIGKALSETWFGDFLQWIHDKKKRNITVKIHDYDTWSMDHTLAHIVLPMLVQLKAAKHGAPFVDEEDVPEDLRDTPEEIAALDVNCGEVSEKHFQRWDWVMDQMIWSFEQELDDALESSYFDHSESDGIDDLEESISKIKYDREGHREFMAKKQNGFRLFGKYYQNLWD